MSIITAEEAQKQIQVPRLARIKIDAPVAPLKPGQAFTVSVQGYDQHGRPFPVEQVDWEAVGCRVDASGAAVAEGQEGYFALTATVGEITATAQIVVKKDGEPGLPPLPPPLPPKGSMAWEGRVPLQKWMNFYTRVLARFAAQPDLALTVRFEVKEGVTSQKADETRVALRELGLDEDGVKEG